MKLSKLTFLLWFAVFPVFSQAKILLPKLFSENMVLQRETAIPVWGWANAGENITVNFNKQTTSTIADATGKWTLKLKPEKAGGPFELTIKGENTINIKNVLVGEVWLCSGQSNMEWTVGQSINAEKELAEADNPMIRHIRVSHKISGIPENDIGEGDWKLSNSTNTKDFTAIGYFFAKKLYNELKVPVGLIHSSWGGTNIETWISREGFESSDEFREMISKMPVLDVAAIGNNLSARKTAKIEALQKYKLTEFNADLFKSASFNDSLLPELEIPKQWEIQVLGQMDGVVWLRKTVTLTAEQSKKNASIGLAKIDDADVSFVNGIEVGKTNKWDTIRKYEIPAGTLKEGKNIISVRVEDTGGGGGIYGETSDLFLDLGDEKIPLAGNWKFQVEKLSSGVSENEFPSLAYNAMINPLIPYSVRGVLWYQGESNAGRSYQYRTAFPLLINDWRKKWKSDFPFYFVQLATYGNVENSNNGSGWAELREAQSMTLKLAKTGMAVTTDIGNPKDVHPINKQEVGRRLAAIALHDIFKQPVVSRSPSFRSMKIDGNKVVISFNEIGGGLMTTNKTGEVFGFEIAANDRVFYNANAVIKGNTVIIESDKVSVPTAVRFGWSGDASVNNLFNQEGFPADPFRTDDWKTVTKDAKYQFTEIPK